MLNSCTIDRGLPHFFHSPSTKITIIPIPSCCLPWLNIPGVIEPDRRERGSGAKLKCSHHGPLLGQIPLSDMNSSEHLATCISCLYSVEEGFYSDFSSSSLQTCQLDTLQSLGFQCMSGEHTGKTLELTEMYL